MKLFALCISACLALATQSGRAPKHVQPSGENWTPPAALIHLSSLAQRRANRPELQRYAEREKSLRWRGFAYLVLGYQEYQAKEFTAARKDLLSAVETNFPFADIARYLAADAAQQSNDPGGVLEILKDFDKKYPGSIERIPAIELFAAASIATGRPSLAIPWLEAAPELQEQPALTSLLAQAYQKAGELENAARTLQTIYYKFPNSYAEPRASKALDELKIQLGAKFPAPTDEAATTRAGKLYGASRYPEAFKEYSQLLTIRKTGLLAWQWNLGRARCLIQLNRPDEAIETLVGAAAPNTNLDEERLAVLVDAYESKKDEPSLLRTLDELRTANVASPWYESSLAMGAYYFLSQAKWDQALNLYSRLIAAFPKGRYSEIASWRVAWINYLQNHKSQAEHDFLKFVRGYPDSYQTPAAMFYIGNIEQRQGDRAQARAVYELIAKRFIHNYYSTRSRERLKQLKPGASAAEKSATAKEELPAAQLSRFVSPAPQLHFNTCSSLALDVSARPAQALESLHLTRLAIEVLGARLSTNDKNPELNLLLARWQVADHQAAPALVSARRVIPDYDMRSFDSLPRAIWDLLYPREFWSSVRRYARLNHLDPYLVMALIRQESAFNPEAVSSAGALGLMQILPETVGPARSRRIISQRLFNPAYNLRFGCLYLRRTLQKFHGNIDEALAAYNAGDSRVSGWMMQYSTVGASDFVEMIPWTETRLYVRTVVRDAEVYRELMSSQVKYKLCR